MTQHFTKATVSAAFYCSVCEKSTQHRIDDGRRGPCLDCIERLEVKHRAALVGDWRYEFEERAAVKQFMGGMDRETAEREARAELIAEAWIENALWNAEQMKRAAQSALFETGKGRGYILPA